MSQLDRDTLFVGLTRSQMLAGVTYNFVIINTMITTELFLIFKTPWVLAAALLLHGVGWLACLREPRIFDIWLTRLSRCGRVRTWSIWRCNSYRA